MCVETLHCTSPKCTCTNLKPKILLRKYVKQVEIDKSTIIVEDSNKPPFVK